MQPSRKAIERPPGHLPVRHLLDQHTTTGVDRAVQYRGVGRVVLLPDVLAHFDRGDGVEVVALGDLPIVVQPYLDAARSSWTYWLRGSS